MHTLYSRAGCHLCDTAKNALERAGIEFKLVSIESNLALEAEYGFEIPVLVNAFGKTVLKGVFSDARVAGLKS